MPADGAAADAPNALGKRPRLETVQPRKRLLLDGVLLYGDEKVGPTRQRRHGYGPRRLLTPSGLPAASWWGCRRHRAWWPQTRRRKRSGSGRTRLPSRSGGRFRKRPGTAMAIADAGWGLAFLGLPLMSWMIEDLGWRFTYSALGVVLMGIAVPLHLFVIDRVKSTSRAGGRYGMAGLGRVTILRSSSAISAARRPITA